MLVCCLLIGMSFVVVFHLLTYSLLHSCIFKKTELLIMKLNSVLLPVFITNVTTCNSFDPIDCIFTLNRLFIG